MNQVYNKEDKNDVKDKRFHIAIKLTEEEQWKLREVAVRKKQRIGELVTAKVLELLKEDKTE